MKIIVLGLGSIGTRHAANMREMSTVELVTADPEPRRQSVDYHDWRKCVIENIDSHGAIIASPSEWHLEQMLLLNTVGIPFFVEKPICLRDQVDALCHVLAGRVSHKCAVGFCYRFHPITDAVYSDRELHFRASEALFGRYGATVGETMGSHSIDLACHLLGQPEAVTLRDTGTTLSGMVKHSHGVSYYDMHIDGAGRDSTINGIPVPPDDNMYKAEIRAWMGLIRGISRDKRLATLRDGVKVASVLQAATRTS